MAFTPKPERRTNAYYRAIGRRSLGDGRYPRCTCGRIGCRKCPEGGRRQGESPLAYAKRVYRAWLGRAYYGTGTKKRAPLTVARARLARQQARFTRMRDEALTVMTWGAVPYPVWGVIPAPLDALTQAAQLDGQYDPPKEPT